MRSLSDLCPLELMTVFLLLHVAQRPSSLFKDLALALMRIKLVLVIGWGSLVPLLEHGAELVAALEVRLPLLEVLLIGCGHSGVP